MKFNKLFLGAAILSMGVLASCSSDDEPAVNSGNDVKGEGYITVKFKTAGIGESRAEGDTYEVGTDAEGKVTAANTRFYFFDAKGNPFTMTAAGNVNGTAASNMVTPLEVNQPQNNTNGNTTGATGVLVLGKGTGQGYEGVVPYQAVCVSNGDETFMNGLANKSLDVLALMTAEGEANKFMMSNSNYDGAGRMGAVTVGDKIKSTPAEANADPVDFYLERLAVKVRIDSETEKEFTAQEKKEDGSYTDAIYTIYDVNLMGNQQKKETKLRVQLTDWQLVKTVAKAHTIKQLPENMWTGWNDATYHRSYWAKSLATASDVQNKFFDIYNDANWKSFKSSDYTDYTWEFTDAQNVDSENDRDHNAITTSVVVRAYVQEQVGEEWKNIELVKWAGTYYTLAAFKQQIVNTYNPEHKDAQITVDEVNLEYLGGVGDDNNYWKVMIGEGESAEEYTTYTNIKYWKNGVTSFYLNIKHGVDNDGANVYGVVRNHIYEYDFTNIVGLGVPGNNPDKESGETFVAAGINVLNWKIVSNSVVLE